MTQWLIQNLKMMIIKILMNKNNLFQKGIMKIKDYSLIKINQIILIRSKKIIL